MCSAYLKEVVIHYFLLKRSAMNSVVSNPLFLRKVVEKVVFFYFMQDPIWVSHWD